MRVTTVNTIETSSVCNNKCRYCPASVQGRYRPVGFMSMGVFEAALEWVRVCVWRGTQRELNLFGVGEPLLHPNIVEMVRLARLALPLHFPVHLNTNGNRLTEELAWRLKDVGVSEIDITGHDAYVTARTIRILKKVGIRGQVSYDFTLQPNNWAGQVDWFEPDYTYECPWLHKGQVMVMSDGRVTRCCIDAFARGVYCSVNDSLDTVVVAPFALCKECHQTVPKEVSAG